MNERIYFYELKCYKKSTKEQKKIVNKENYYDLSRLPTETLKAEFNGFIRQRGRCVSLLTIKTEYVHYNRLCEMLKKCQLESILDKPYTELESMLRKWMFQKGLSTTKQKINMYGNKTLETAALIRYFQKFYNFVYDGLERDEKEKDVWRLERLNIPVIENPIRNVKTVSFTGIPQTVMREQVKQVILLHLKYEAVTTIKRELSAIKKLAVFLQEQHPEIECWESLNREIIEEFLIYLKIEIKGGNGKRDDLIKIRNVLESMGKIYQEPVLENLFLTSDFPPARQGEFKTYSDAELKRLNAGIAELDEQLSRAMIIHQMLGTRISDTLTLRKDCLFKEGEQDMITIYQPKTRRYEKPISRELAHLIRKAIQYANRCYETSQYIFADEKESDKPLKYGVLQNKVMKMIIEKDLRDDHGELFGFGTHMFRHYYGVKLTELHIDDWTIAKLLGHKNTKSVRFYRKMSDQIMAEETKQVRAYMSDIIKQSLEGWGTEYEQIR